MFNFQPYRLVESTDLFETYEVNPLYPWWQVINIVSLVFGYAVDSIPILITTGVSWIIYLTTSITLAGTAANKISLAGASSLTSSSGSKFSYSNPATIRLPKEPTIDPLVVDDALRQRTLSLFGSKRSVLAGVTLVIIFLIATKL